MAESITGSGAVVFAYLSPDELGDEGGCSDEVCGITDTFTRTVSGGWGASDSGLTWNTDIFATGGVASVDGSAGQILITEPTQPRAFYLGGSGSLPETFPLTSSALRVMRFQIPDYVPSLNNSYYIRWRSTDTPGIVIGPQVLIGSISGGPGGNSGLSFASSVDTPIPSLFWTSTATYTWTQYINGTGQLVHTITDGTDTYTDGPLSTPTVAFCAVVFGISGSLSADITFRVLDIDIPEINRCTAYRFDNFNRTVATGTGWGGIWTSVFDDDAGVNGTEAYALAGTQSYLRCSHDAWRQIGGFQMLIKFRSPSAITGSAFANEFTIYNPSSGNSITVGWTMKDDSTTNGTFYVGSFIVGGGGYNEILDKSDWVANQTYYIRWDWGSNVSRARIWSGSNEPSTWDVSHNWTVGEGSIPSAPNSVLEYNSDLLRDMYIDYIDFDYDGKPCYVDQVSSVPVYGGETVEPSEDDPETWAPVVVGSGTYGG